MEFGNATRCGATVRIGIFWEREAPEARAAAKPAHLVYVERESAYLAYACPFMERDSGALPVIAATLYLLRTDDTAKALSIAMDDPYARAGMWSRIDIYEPRDVSGPWGPEADARQISATIDHRQRISATLAREPLDAMSADGALLFQARLLHAAGHGSDGFRPWDRLRLSGDSVPIERPNTTSACHYTIPVVPRDWANFSFATSDRPA